MKFNKKIIITLTAFALSTLITSKANANHGSDEKNRNNLITTQFCQNTPASLNTASKRAKYVKDKGGIKKFVENYLDLAYTKSKRNVQEDFLVNKCLIVYGGPYSVKDGTQMWRSNKPLFLGYNSDGEVMPNPEYPEWFNEKGNDVLTRTDFIWYYQPWNNKALLNNDRDSIRNLANSPNIKLSDEDFGTIIDKYHSTKNDGRGSFLGNQPQDKKPWVIKKDGIYLANAIKNYGHVRTRKTDWSPGMVTLFFHHKDGPSYAPNQASFVTFYIPANNPFNPKNDLELSNTYKIVTKSGKNYAGEPIKYIEVTVKNNGDEDIKGFDISYEYEGRKYCEYYDGTIKQKDKKGDTVTLKLGNESLSKCSGKSTVKDLKMPKNEDTEKKTIQKNLKVVVDGLEKIKETNEKNNEKNWDITVNGLTAKATVWVSNSYSKSVTDVDSYLTYDEEEPLLYSNKPFYIKMTAGNDMKYLNIDAPCKTNSSTEAVCNSSSRSEQVFKYEIYNSFGKKVLMGERTYKDLKPSSSASVRAGESGDIQQDKIKLPKGDYIVQVFVPNYDNEYTYGDNVTRKVINVRGSDLELLDYLTVDPTPAQKSDTPISSMKIEVRNHGELDYKNVRIDYYWTDKPSEKFCEVVKLLPAMQTTTVTIARGSTNTVPSNTINGTCAGSNANPKTEYQRFDDEKPNKGIKLFVGVNLDKMATTEGNLSNNSRVFEVLTKGLNAKVSDIETTSTKKSNGKSDLDISVRFYNGMMKPITSPCISTSSTLEVCKGVGHPNKTTIEVWDTKGTATKTDDSLMKRTTKNFTQTNANYYSSAVHDTLEVPKGSYRVIVQMPHYKNEYTYSDNIKEKVTYVGLTDLSDSRTTCKEEKVSYISTELAKICINVVPKFPSTTVENGYGSYAKVSYFILPSPFPTYNISKQVIGGETLETFSYNEDKSDPSNSGTSFIRHKDSKYGNTGYYKYRGRMFAKEIKFDFNIIDPSNKKVPSSEGTLYYTLPSNCYDTGKLDITSSCKEAEFYIAKDTSGDVNSNRTQPSKDNRIVFKNPGVYTMNFKATETQYYRYETLGKPCVEYNTDKKGNITSCKRYEYQWSNPAWFSGRDYDPGFVNPVVNYKQPPSQLGYSTWTSDNDPYNYKFQFPVTGISTGSGSK